MSKTTARKTPKQLKEYDRTAFRLSETSDGDLDDRHLFFDHVVSMDTPVWRVMDGAIS